MYRGGDKCIEPIPVEDVFVTDLARVEKITSTDAMRFWCTTEETIMGVKTAVVRAKLIIPMMCAAAMCNKSAQALISAMQENPELATYARKLARLVL